DIVSRVLAAAFRWCAPPRRRVAIADPGRVSRSARHDVDELPSRACRRSVGRNAGLAGRALAKLVFRARSAQLLRHRRFVSTLGPIKRGSAVLVTPLDIGAASQ